MHTLKSALDLISEQFWELRSDLEQEMDQWYRWASCERRSGTYPVFVMQPELAALFQMQVITSDSHPPILELIRLDDPDQNTPRPWAQLSKAMKRKGRSSLKISIQEEDGRSILVLDTGKKKNRRIVLDESPLPWDLNLMGKWCSHNQLAFYSVFHPGFILTIAHILRNSKITDMTSFDPVQLSDQSLLQESKASLYSFSDGASHHQIIWSDRGVKFGDPGFIAWSMNQNYREPQLALAASDKGAKTFRGLGAMPVWSQEMLSAAEFFISGALSMAVDKPHQQFLQNLNHKLLTIDVPPPPSTTALQLPTPPENNSTSIPCQNDGNKSLKSVNRFSEPFASVHVLRFEGGLCSNPVCIPISCVHCFQLTH